MFAAPAVCNSTAPEKAITYTFLKEEDRWFISLPDYVMKGSGKKNELVEGAQTMLNTIARGLNTLSLQLDTQPFEDADSLELIELCEAPRGGGYYRMHTCNGRRINKKMWLCDLMLFVFGDMPEGVYFRKVGEGC
jgi:hypothetical protein